MKKRKWMAAGMMLALVVFAACDNPGEAAMAVTGRLEERLAEADSQTAGRKAAGTKTADGTEQADTYGQPAQLAVYYGNGRADGLERELLEVDEITPEAVIGVLSRHNIVSIDTKVLGFGIKADERERTVLELDLSKSFGEYVRTMGESGEKVAMAALVNTFLENYRADGLLLTVGGEKLETSHGVYGEELVFEKLEQGKEETEVLEVWRR